MIYLRNGIWWADLRRAGGGRRSTGCTDQAAAMMEAAKMLVRAERVRAGLEPEEVKVPTVPDAVRAWADAMTASGLDARYIAIARANIRALGLGRLEGFSPPAIEKYLLGVRAARSAGTANNHRSSLTVFCDFCVRHGWLAKNPVLVPSFPNKAPRRRRALTVAELKELLTCPKIPEERRKVYRFLTQTGLRAGEASQLCWVHVGQNTLNLPAGITKSGRDEQVPLPGGLVRSTSCLLMWPDGIPDARRFRLDLKLAGITRVDARGRIAVLHSLRHTYRSLLGAVGATDAQARALMRHSSGLESRYTDDALLELTGVVERVERMIA